MNRGDQPVKLGLIASIAFYIGLIIIQAKYPLFDYDFVSFWSVGRIANTQGYSHIYDLSTLAKYQGKDDILSVVPTPFPALFIVPFQIAALFPMAIGAWVWRFINLGAFILYCFFFKKFLRQPIHAQNLFALLLSLPVYINFAWAQVNVFAMIGIGEFIRLSLEHRPFLRGTALGLLMIKPQMTILLILMLIFQREWKSVAGFVTSAVTITFLSTLLTGVKGGVQLVDLWIKYSAGLPSNAPQYMVNWRMIGFHLESVLNSTASWLIIIVGMIFSGILTIFLWRKQQNLKSPAYFFYVILGTLSATLLISWHSHLHHMLILIPALIGIMMFDTSSKQFIYYWVYSGIILYFVIILLGFSTLFLSLPAGFGSSLLGLWGFSSNLTFLIWSLKNTTPGRTVIRRAP